MQTRLDVANCSLMMRSYHWLDEAASCLHPSTARCKHHSSCAAQALPSLTQCEISSPPVNSFAFPLKIKVLLITQYIVAVH